MGYRWDHVAVIGVGLLGGSIGLALREAQLARRITGVGRDAARLARARQAGVITHDTTDLELAVREAEVVVVATPVDTIAPLVRRVVETGHRPWLITDVGSVKQPIVSALKDLPAEAPFVGSHPLAGSEKSGFQHAREDLLRGRVTFVTPDSSNAAAPIQRAVSFWESLGSQVEIVDPDFHDQLMAATSHLPHLVASALAAAVDPKHQSAIGSGYRDTTRLAAGSVEMWVPILLANREHLLSEVKKFKQVVSAWETALEQGDAKLLAELLTKGKNNRDAVGG